MVSNANIKARMSWRPLQIVAVTLALITAGTVCLGQCAAKPCHNLASASQERSTASIPPCHKSQPTKPATSSEQCNLALMFIGSRTTVAGDLEPQLVATATTDFAPGVVWILPSEANGCPLYRENSPLSSPEIVFSTVLRL